MYSFSGMRYFWAKYSYFFSVDISEEGKFKELSKVSPLKMLWVALWSLSISPRGNK